MDTLHSNLNHLVHIKLIEKHPSENYTRYHPAKEKKWYRKAKPEMWSGGIAYDEQTEKQLIDRGYLVEALSPTLPNKQVWVKPSVKLWFSDSRNSIDYMFNTDEEANAYISNILNLCKVEGNFTQLTKISTKKL
jgi:hypothetical protein